MDEDNAITLRPAKPEDRGTIRRMVVMANLYPFSLRWQSFVVAENGGGVLGAGQIREHSDGCRELASVVVERDFRRRGVGSRLVARLLENEAEPVYLSCREDLEPFYHPFGFRRLSPLDLPFSVAYFYRIEALGTLALSVFRPSEPNLISMVRRPEGSEEPDGATPSWKGRMSGHPRGDLSP